MARTTEVTPEGSKARNYEQQGYGTEVVLDQICHLHGSSRELNIQVKELISHIKNMLEVQMAQSKILESMNDRLGRLEGIETSLKRLENIETSLQRLEPIQKSIEQSTSEIDKLEDVMVGFSRDQKISTDLLVEQSHEMIEVFRGTDGDEARSRAQVAAEEKRKEKEENQS